MGNRGEETVVGRAWLPLTQQDEAELNRLRSSASSQQALRALTGVDATSASETMLHEAIFHAGLRAVDHEVERAGYAAMSDEHRLTSAQRRLGARARRPAWAQEP
ncbi:MAG: hypothetical protein KGP12_10185 [Actinomycetales bacterium]|nr:hypothetical protein [Actinomycetales bacterium]